MGLTIIVGLLVDDLEDEELDNPEQVVENAIKVDAGTVEEDDEVEDEDDSDDVDDDDDDDDEDEDEETDFQASLSELRNLNRVLVRHGLPWHREAIAPQADYDSWNLTVRYGVLENFYELVSRLMTEGKINLSADQASHLLGHSSADGYYVPQVFDRLIEDDGYTIGSSQVLQAICREVFPLLDFPRTLDEIPIDYSGDGDELDSLFRELEHQGWTWPKEIGQIFMCIALYQAATLSIINHMAIVYG